MIECLVVRRKTDILSFQVKGHAGFADVGNDVVCAAVSALVTNAVNSCEGLLQVKPQVHDDGETLACDLLGSVRADVQLLFQSMVFGLKEIARDYPHNVKVRLVEAKE